MLKAIIKFYVVVGVLGTCSFFNRGLHAQDEPNSYLRLMREITAYHVKLSKIGPMDPRFKELEEDYYRNAKPKMAVLEKIIYDFDAFFYPAFTTNSEMKRKFKKDGNNSILNAFGAAIKNHDDEVVAEHLKALINLTEASLGGNYFWLITPKKWEPHVICNVLEYALYHQNYVAFHYLLKQIFACALRKDQLENQEEHRLITFLNEDFLALLLQDPEQARFVEVLSQSECGHIKLADLLRYLVENSYYKEIAVLIQSGVSAHSLYRYSRVELGSMLQLAVDEEDIIAVSLLKKYQACAKPDEIIFYAADREALERQLPHYDAAKLIHLVDQIIGQARSFLLKMYYPESEGDVVRFIEQRSLGLLGTVNNNIDYHMEQEPIFCECPTTFIDDPLGDEIEKKMSVECSWDLLDLLTDEEFECEIDPENKKKYYVPVLFKKFVEGRGVNASIKGYTLLELVCKYELLHLFEWLIHHGARPTDRALMLASTSGFHEGVATLVAVGQNPDAMSYDPGSHTMNTPLEAAITFQVPHKDIFTCELLLSLGASKLSHERAKILNCIDRQLNEYLRSRQDQEVPRLLRRLKQNIYNRAIGASRILQESSETQLHELREEGKQRAEVWRKRLSTVH